MSSKLAIVILAAGKGKRMNNPEMAKVLYPVAGRPMIDHVVDRALGLSPEKIVVVVGHQKSLVMDHLKAVYPGKPIEFVEQREQLGTGHAVMQCEAALLHFDGDVMILSGDVPLLSAATMERLIGEHRASASPVTMITADLADPTGYGRIVRNGNASVKKIVEHKDATDAEKALTEINAGIYVFDRRVLFDALTHVVPNNAQGEYYLTDVLGILTSVGHEITAVKVDNPDEVLGVNTVAQLEEMNAKFRA